MRQHYDGKTMTHLGECGILTKLLIDLKKRELKYEYEPITIERLDEACKAIAAIQQCRKQVLFKCSR